MNKTQTTPLTASAEPKSAVWLISGFLGAGKTTLMKRILSWAADLSATVVLVNEFGKVGIDGDLLKNHGSDVVELTSGCICCTLSSDLIRTLGTIRRQYRPQRVLIEASGVADPTSIAAALEHAELKAHMRLEKVVTVLDADFWEARENFGPLFFNQIRMADLVLLNKIDQVDQEAVPVYLKELHEAFPDSQVIPTVACDIDPGSLWSPSSENKFSDPAHRYGQITLRGLGEIHPSGCGQLPEAKPVDSGRFVTFLFEDPRALDRERFDLFIKRLPFEVFRMKGPVRFGDRTRFVNCVGGKCGWSEWDGDPGTRLAFVGWKVDPQAILRRLELCAV